MSTVAGSPASSVPSAMRITDGCVALGGRPVLRGIDLRVDQGEVVAVLGANGSGKSTLVRATLGLTPLSSGSVELFGTPLPRFRAWRRIGFVPQRTSATTGVPASVGEVVAAGRLAHRRPLQPLRRVDKEAVRRALGAVGIADRVRDRVSTLSGGQQQRVLIARALAGEPDLLILDEPIAGVDLASQEVFARVLADLTEQGTTVVVVLHEMGPLEPLISRTLVMREGRVAYDGEPLDSFRDVPHAYHGCEEPEPEALDYHLAISATLDRATDPDRRSAS